MRSLFDLYKQMEAFGLEQIGLHSTQKIPGSNPGEVTAWTPDGSSGNSGGSFFLTHVNVTFNKFLTFFISLLIKIVLYLY